METEQFDLPDFWASPLINGDYSGLEDDDITALNDFTDNMVEEYGRCWAISVTDDDGGDFRRYHDASKYGVLACNVVTYTFDITQRKQEE